jgi:hypothetical protein
MREAGTEGIMPHLLATYNVRYFWDIPDDVVLFSVNDPRNKGEEDGAWYIKWGTLHYCWKGKWNTIEGTEDGFVDKYPDDPEFSED